MEHLLALIKLHALFINQLGVIGEDHDTALLPVNFVCSLCDVVQILESQESGDDGSCWGGLFRIWAFAQYPSPVCSVNFQSPWEVDVQISLNFAEE